MSKFERGQTIEEGVRTKSVVSMIEDAYRRPGEIEVMPLDLEQLQQTIEGEADHVLPGNLVEQLHFDKLDWQELRHERSMSRLLLGFIPNLSAQPKPHEAIGTIEIERMRSNKDRRVCAVDIRVAGLAADTKGDPRVVAVSYNAFINNAHSVNVSIANTEFTDRLRGVGQEYRESIPTTLSEHQGFHYTSGFITRKMSELTRHTNALRAYSSTQDTNIIFPDRYMTLLSGYTPSESQGFWIKYINNSQDLVVAQDKGEASRWAVTIPLYLAKRETSQKLASSNTSNWLLNG